MSVIEAVNGSAPTTWFVFENGAMTSLRPAADSLLWAQSAATSLKARYYIRPGRPPVPAAHIPQEWLVYDTKPWAEKNRPAKRIFAATVDAVHMWCVHKGQAHGQV